jgi:phosphomannomutase
MDVDVHGLPIGRRNDADLGIIFDTDCDRAAVVGADGREINRNRLIALMSAIVLEKYPGGTIVTDSITSTGLAAFIKGLGGVHRRFKRGYKNVIDEAVRLEKAGASGGRGVLRLVLLDARLSNVRWIGQVAGDSLSAFGPAVTASVAARLANVVAP